MSKTPLVSVILPSYNHVRFVTSAVETVLHQQMRDFELIVVDDGSTDGTPDRVEKIKDERMQLIRLPQNRLRHPRNLALSLARGRYIAFQNSDDEWSPDKLSKQLEILEQQKNVAVCFTDVELVDEQNQALTSSWAHRAFTTENQTNFYWLHRFFTAGNCFCITSALARRDIIEAVGRFRGSLVQLSDFDLWVRMAALGDFHVIKEKLTLMRIVAGKAASEQHGPILTSANLSAPRLSSANRLIFEFASVFENFAKPPILDFIPRIFRDVPDLPASDYIRQAWLAKYAWSLNTVRHALFADRLMSSIMENETARNEVTDAFGAEIIKEFVKRRSQLSIQMVQEESTHTL